MSQILSQEEVDSLLKGVSGDVDFELFDFDDGDTIPYDLTSHERIIRGRMPTLEVIHDRFVKRLCLTLSSVLQKEVDISVGSTEFIKFGEFLKYIPTTSSLNIFRINPLGDGLLVLEHNLVFSIIDSLFGGIGNYKIKEDTREFTEIEHQIVKRVVVSALEDLETSWNPVFPLKFTYNRTEINPRFTALVPHSEIALVVTFDVEIAGNIVKLILCIPYPVLYPIRKKLDCEFHDNEYDYEIPKLREKLEDLLEVETVVALNLGEFSIDQIRNLKIDDIVTTNIGTSSEYCCTINEGKKLKVKPFNDTNFKCFELITPKEEQDTYLDDIPFNLKLVVGQTYMSIDKITNIQPGDIIELDTIVGESFSCLTLENKKLFQCEIVVVNERYGFRILDFRQPLCER